MIFLGGVLLGSSPDWIRLPGPYMPSADFRSQDPETWRRSTGPPRIFRRAVPWQPTEFPQFSSK